MISRKTVTDVFIPRHLTVQRYYASAYGRFNTVDPYGRSARPNDPGSWNRYAYVGGDPVNHTDRRGLCVQDLTTGIAYSGYAQQQEAAYSGTGGFNDEVVDSLDCNYGGESGNGYIGSGSGADSSTDPCVQLGDALLGNPVNCTAPVLMAFFPDGDTGSPAAPQCPLEGIIGNYTVGPGTVNVLFAPDMAAALDEAMATLNTEGIIPQINSGFRTASTQTGLRNGGSGANPAAAPGQSWHEVGEAVDIQMRGNPNASQIIAAMAGAGLTYGGVFNDLVHFQLPSAVVRGTRTSSGAPRMSQVQNCEREHPNGR